MNIQSVLRVALFACLFWVAAGCDGLGGGVNVYVDVDEPAIGSYLTYLSNVGVGDDGHSGANLLDRQIGTFTKGDKTYRTFSVRPGKYDFYMEWYDPTQSDYFRNERVKNVPVSFSKPIKLHFYEWYNNVGTLCYINTYVEWSYFEP